MGLNRRRFLRVGGLSLLATACAPARVGSRSVGDEPLARESSARVFTGPAGDALLVTVFLRGGADGLHLVPPTGDRGYESLRGSLALSETLPFSREFGLHPELAPLAPLVARRQLAVVHAVGSPHPTRSHFEAQDFMELGEPGPTRLADGWLTRALRGHAEEDAFASVALTGEQPLALRGSGAFAIGDPVRFGLPGVSERARAALEGLYRSDFTPLHDAGTRALGALSEYESAMGGGARGFGRRRGRGRRGRDSLSQSAEHLLQLDRSGLGLRAAFLETGNWDTHTNQGTDSGQMANRIRDLGEGIATLADGLGDRRDWILVAMTEFGRTVRPNGSRGSDHGHGSVMFVAGPRVRGGVYGDWAGLADDRLHEGRDLPVLTDWRSVLDETLHAHLGATPPRDTFPGFTPERLGILG